MTKEEEREKAIEWFKSNSAFLLVEDRNNLMTFIGFLNENGELLITTPMRTTVYSRNEVKTEFNILEKLNFDFVPPRETQIEKKTEARRYIECAYCEGSGMVPNDRQTIEACEECNGTGKFLIREKEAENNG